MITTMRIGNRSVQLIALFFIGIVLLLGLSDKRVRVIQNRCEKAKLSNEILQLRACDPAFVRDPSEVVERNVDLSCVSQAQSKAAFNDCILQQGFWGKDVKPAEGGVLIETTWLNDNGIYLR